MKEKIFMKNQEVTDNEDGTVTIKGKCVFIKEEYSCTVPKQGLLAYLDKGLRIQDAMPTVSADDREFIISGISPKGWEQTFGKG